MAIDDRVLLHQVHPAKLGADISASVISNVLLWRRRPLAAIGARLLLPVAGSALVLVLTDVERLRETGPGHYVLSHMTPAATAVRLVGDVMMAAGSWSRRPQLIAAGLLTVVAGWTPVWGRRD